MKNLAIVTASVALSLVVTACATQSTRTPAAAPRVFALSRVVPAWATQPTGPPAAGPAYTGEVWTWDEQDSTVTLRRGAENIRVKVTPDQLRGLELHQKATVRGELAPPM